MTPFPPDIRILLDNGPEHLHPPKPKVKRVGNYFGFEFFTDETVPEGAFEIRDDEWAGKEGTRQ